MECKIKQKWIDIEKEHTKSIKEATKIVNDHVNAHGCRYYPELIKLEKKLK
jgi:hypothetical protein